MRRVLMLGLDALVPNLIEKFAGEGLMPNFKLLFENGCFTRLLSSIPAQTPANWHTVATGAKPGTHSVVVWGAHRPDDPIAETHRSEAFSSGLCLAEYIWETAARFGKRSVIMNYLGYPPTTDKALHIDWLYQPARSYYDICPATVFHNTESKRGRTVELKPAEGWSSFPFSKKRPLETVIDVAPSSEGTGPIYHLLLTASNSGYDTLLICNSKDPSTAVASIRVGEWSEWLREKFNTTEAGEAEAGFRFKFLQCSPDGGEFRLYQSEAFATDGRFVSDHRLGASLIEQFGPYIYAVASAHLHLNDSLLDRETVGESLRDEASWWARAVEFSMNQTGAELLYLHWHLPDCVGHQLLQFIDPTGSVFRPELAEKAWDDVSFYYTAIDRFVGAFLQRFDLKENVIAIVSEHGMPANKKAVSLVNAFKDKGWLEFNDDRTDVIWEKSKVFFDQNHLWINLEGREPTGIVPPSEYHHLRTELQTLMRSITDPETGQHVFSFVLTRDEAPVVGLVGEHIGDLVFCYAGGYRWSGTEVLKLGEGRVVFPCGGGNHGPMIPTYETEVGSVYGTFLLAGKGVRRAVKEEPSRKGSRTTADVAPTLAYLLGIQPPAQSEGRVLHEFLEGFESKRPERKLLPLRRSLRPAPRLAKPKLKGDVTDEI